jgi:uncharacterized membrane protein
MALGEYCMSSLKRSVVVAIAGWALLTSTSCLAQSKEAIDRSVERAVQQFNLLDARHVTLEKKAAGILIFPQVTIVVL